jgi:hypothetical protein
MDDHRHIELRSQVKLGDKQLDLGIFIPKFPVIIQTYLPYGDHPGQGGPLFYGLGPFFSGVLHLRGADPHGMIHVGRGFEVFVDLRKVMKAVANRNDPGNGSLTGFLNNYELLNRVIANEPYMGVSIKILHGLSKRNDLDVFQTGYSLLYPIFISLSIEIVLTIFEKYRLLAGRRRCQAMTNVTGFKKVLVKNAIFFDILRKSFCGSVYDDSNCYRR